MDNMLTSIQGASAQEVINDRKVFPYYTLPGEIRNKIMEYMFVPGELHLRVPPADARKGIRPLNAWRRWHGNTGLAFMGSCRTARQEGLQYYYAQNTFYLPPGDIKATLLFFDVLEPHCAAMIKSLGVQIRITDELLGIFDTAVKEANYYWQAHSGYSVALMQADSLATTIANKVQQVWLTKLDWIRNCDGYDQIKIQYRRHTITLNGSNLQDELRDISNWTGRPMLENCNKELTKLLRDAKTTLIDSLRMRLRHGNIDSARTWIVARKASHDYGYRIS